MNPSCLFLFFQFWDYVFILILTYYFFRTDSRDFLCQVWVFFPYCKFLLLFSFCYGNTSTMENSGGKVKLILLLWLSLLRILLQTVCWHHKISNAFEKWCLSISYINFVGISLRCFVSCLGISLFFSGGVSELCFELYIFF